MARIHGTRERRHQPIYDTLLNSTGAPATTLSPTTKLFGANAGNIALSNLQVAGQLAADQTYVILALRCYMHFAGTNDIALFQQVSSQLQFNLELGDKSMFRAPAWYLPAGGGLYGGTEISNGNPQSDAILKLAMPIVIPVRQNISVDATFYAIGTTNAVTTINGAAADDQMKVQYIIDGVQTRDVQ